MRRKKQINLPRFISFANDVPRKAEYAAAGVVTDANVLQKVSKARVIVQEE